MKCVKFGIACFGVVLPLVCAAQSATQPQSPFDAQVEEAVLNDFPAAARTAGMEGMATLQCRWTDHRRLADCSVISESPSGFGFGEASLELAILSRQDPNIRYDPVKSLIVVFYFKRHPASIITKPPLTIEHVITNPAVTYMPRYEDMLKVFPKEALMMHIPGKALVDCFVTDRGALDPCTIVTETPRAYGFGEAALSLAGLYKMKPGLRDGEPEGGRRVHVPFNFRLPEH